ncbi:MAG: threonine synthase [Puniceicoccales bacterium]|jgi:threonine synthase|nr:threonine synthase [Puniceicoccales bacterium]
MKYISTRGGDTATFNEAVMKGIASDGGLFVPETLPDLSGKLEDWRGLGYSTLAHAFLAHFATDIPDCELRDCVERAYDGFPSPVAPLTELGREDGEDSGGAPLYLLELFHGPTLAFKDFPLQLLGQLYARNLHATARPLNILCATSGDTGSAAIHGVPADKGIHSFILYPEGRVSALQERQIACTGSPHVHALAVRGSFDDAQAIVKTILADTPFATAHALTPVNSINIARILAQCVYYLDAALRLNASEANPLEFIVPTGNFGNVLAGWMLGRMGVPGLRFCAATNVNAVVADFFQKGVYRPGPVTPSLAPSMDIQQASNFERWLWWHFDGDGARLRAALETLGRDGALTLAPGDGTAGAGLRATTCDDAALRLQIQGAYERAGCLIDPHTACAFAAVRPDMRTVVLATAHPAKFPEIIAEITGEKPTHAALDELRLRRIAKKVLPADADAVRAAITAALQQA